MACSWTDGGVGREGKNGRQGQGQGQGQRQGHSSAGCWADGRWQMAVIVLASKTQRGKLDLSCTILPTADTWQFGMYGNIPIDGNNIGYLLHSARLEGTRSDHPRSEPVDPTLDRPTLVAMASHYSILSANELEEGGASSSSPPMNAPLASGSSSPHPPASNLTLDDAADRLAFQRMSHSPICFNTTDC